MATELKTIPLARARLEWDTLKAMDVSVLATLNGRNRTGCDLVDHYFFPERLATVGKKGINFFDFVRDIASYKEKHYVQTLIAFCEKNNRYKGSDLKRYYYIYGLCFGRVNAFKVTNALHIYKTYPCTKALDPFCGFGGRLLGAMMENVDYLGFDLNTYLAPAYARLLSDFASDHSSEVRVEFRDAATVDYVDLSTTYAYDMVITSPPYRNIELYRCSEKRDNEEWNLFYRRVFRGMWEGLRGQPPDACTGNFIININEDVYSSVLVPLFGECRERFHLKKAKKNGYDEYVYVWAKKADPGQPVSQPPEPKIGAQTNTCANKIYP